MRNISSKKKGHLLFLVLYEFAIGYIAVAMSLNAIWYLVVSWVFPTLFFLYKLHINRYRYILEALMWSIPGSIFIDWIGHYSRAWSYWDNPLFASTGISVLGIPLESFAWGAIFWIFYVVLYEYFFDENRAADFGKKEKYLVSGLTVASLVAVVFIDFYQPRVPFFFLIVLLLIVFGTVISLAPYRRLAPRILKFGLFVFILGLQVEFFSLSLGLWSFPDGEFIRQVAFFGHIIPIEEILWWILVPMGVATAHEVFADNHR